MLFAGVGYDIGAQLFGIFFFVNDDRANSYDPEDMLQDIDRLVKIPVPSAVDINSPARLRNVKISVDARKECADPLCERILKKMTVVSLDADLAVVTEPISPYLIRNELYIGPLFLSSCISSKHGNDFPEHFERLIDLPGRIQRAEAHADG